MPGREADRRPFDQWLEVRIVGGRVRWDVFTFGDVPTSHFNVTRVWWSTRAWTGRWLDRATGVFSGSECPRRCVVGAILGTQVSQPGLRPLT